MEHHLSLHTRFYTILDMLLPSMGANKVLGEVHGEKHNHGRGKWSIHCHWTAWIKPIRDCLSRHRRKHIFMEDTLSLDSLEKTNQRLPIQTQETAYFYGGYTVIRKTSHMVQSIKRLPI